MSEKQKLDIIIPLICVSLLYRKHRTKIFIDYIHILTLLGLISIRIPRWLFFMSVSKINYSYRICQKRKGSQICCCV